MMSCGRSDNAARITFDQRPIKLRKTLEEYGQHFESGRQVAADAHFIFPQSTWNYFVALGFLDLDIAKAFRKARVEALVDPAQELRRTDFCRLHGWQSRLDLRLRLYVGQVLDLESALSSIRREILPQCVVNVPWRCPVPFDQV